MLELVESVEVDLHNRKTEFYRLLEMLLGEKPNMANFGRLRRENDGLTDTYIGRAGRLVAFGGGSIMGFEGFELYLDR